MAFVNNFSLAPGQHQCALFMQTQKISTGMHVTRRLDSDVTRVTPACIGDRHSISPFLSGIGNKQLPLRKRFQKINAIPLSRPLGGISDVTHMPLKPEKPLVNTVLNKLQKLKGKVSSVKWESFLPMTILFFTMALVNTIVSTVSGTLVMSAPGGGAGVLPFLTVYAAFPLTVGATALYTYASHFISTRRLFTITIGLFAVSNLAFALCLFPNHQALHLPGVADALAQLLPVGLSGVIGMVRNWTFSLFFCLSEMWGDLGITLLFWGFANDMTSAKDAPFLYPAIGIGANVAQCLGGIIVKLFASGSEAAYSSRFQILLFQIVGCMTVVMALHHFISGRNHKTRKQQLSTNIRAATPNELRKDISHPPKGVRSPLRATPKTVVGYCAGRPSGSIQLSKKLAPMSAATRGGVSLMASFRNMPSSLKSLADIPLIRVCPEIKAPTKIQTKAQPKKPEKEKGPSFIDSLKGLSKSEVVKGLGIMTVTQALAVTFIELLWRSQAAAAYPTPAALSIFMGEVQTVIGLVTGSIMLLYPILFKKLGWKGVSSITPILMTVGGLGFFGLSTAYHVFSHFGMTSVAQQLLPLTVLGGAFLYVISRSSKFSLVKPTQEMVYINMDESQRTKGKAAVDVIGANLGKSCGGTLQQLLLVASGNNLLFATPVMFGVYMAMMKGWNSAVKTLAVFQEKKNKDTEHETVKTDTTTVPEQETVGTRPRSPIGEDLAPVEAELGSVVEFQLHPEHDDRQLTRPRQQDSLQSHPVAL